MKNNLNKLFHAIYGLTIWKWTVLAMLIVLIGGGVFFAINYPESERPHVTISKLELKKGKINEDLYQVDDVVTVATFEQYNSKLKALKKKIPGAEWDRTEIELSDDEYERKTTEYYQNYALYYAWYMEGIISNLPEPPAKKVSLPYSMKKFMDDILESQEIDSADFDAKLVLLSKIDHFLEMTDKKGVDTLLVDKFKGVLRSSKNLTIEEMKAVEKLHLSITKTPLVFSLTKVNSPKERQDQLFNLYECAANLDITPARFEQMNRIAKSLKSKLKMKDTVAVLNVVHAALNTDFKEFKEKEESVDMLELQCVEDFFFSGKIDYKEKDVLDRFKKYSKLFAKKLEAANLEKRAREILRQENRDTGRDWMYFGFFFTCMGVMIVFLYRLNAALNTTKTN